jgi:hypothetical protein
MSPLSPAGLAVVPPLSGGFSRRHLDSLITCTARAADHFRLLNLTFNHPVRWRDSATTARHPMRQNHQMLASGDALSGCLSSWRALCGLLADLLNKSAQFAAVLTSLNRAINHVRSTPPDYM